MWLYGLFPNFSPIQHAYNIAWWDGVLCIITYHNCKYHMPQGMGLNVLDIERIYENNKDRMKIYRNIK
jgi:hypothetical protein